jgi:hypothetical protein
MAPVTRGVMIITEQVKAEIETQKQKLTTLRDDIKVRLHLASMDAKKEWDDKLSPKLLEVEDLTKNITESSRSTLNDLVAKAEDFLARLKKSNKNDHAPPPSVH